jgi:hypothetical protein
MPVNSLKLKKPERGRSTGNRRGEAGEGEEGVQRTAGERSCPQTAVSLKGETSWMPKS